MNTEKMLTTKEAAERLDVSVSRIHKLIKAGRLPSQQFGRDHLIKESDLDLVAVRKAGRPPKSQTVTPTTPKKSPAKKPTATFTEAEKKAIRTKQQARWKKSK